MRLNMDCLRSILLCVEENTSLRQFCVFVDEGLNEAAEFVGNACDIPPYQAELLKEYSNDVLIYHVRYGIQAELIVPFEQSFDYQLTIADLTPKGHELLSTIREKDNWTKTKEIGGKIGAFGLNMVSKIAEGIATAWLKQQLGLL